MRISDWSSDVCSSDLGEESVACITHRRFVADAPDRDRGAVAIAQDFLGEHVARGGERLRIIERDAPVDRDFAPHEQPEFVGHPRHHLRMRIMRSEEHTSELQSLMRISYAGFCLKKKKHKP